MELTVFKSNLPAANIAAFKQALEQTVAAIPDSTGALFLKLTKGGEWIYGQDGVEVQPGSHWAINPANMRKGYIAWGTGAVLGKITRNIVQPPVLPSDLPPAPAGCKKGWEEVVCMELACITGEDKGTVVEYEQNSDGGIKAFRQVAEAILKQAQVSDTDIVPVVELVTDSYIHREYGKIFKPVFKVVSWAPLNGAASPASAAPAAEQQVKEEKPVVARRRRAPA